MSRIFSPKTVCWLMVAILVVSLIPLLWISFYSFPMADDFSFSRIVRDAWDKSHNLPAVAGVLFSSIVDNFFHWQGSYFSTLLGSVQPALLGEHMYFLTAWILIGATVLATFLLTFSVCHHVFKQSGYEIPTIIACVILLMFIQWIPSPVQGFFWWDGAIVYVGVQMLFIASLAGIIRCLVNGRMPAITVVLLSLSAFLVGGGNYITALLQCELLFLLLLYAFWAKKNIRLKLVLVFAFAAAGLLINVLAPGNSYRQSTYTPMALLPSIKISFATAFRHSCLWLPRIAVGLLFLLPFLWMLPLQDACKKVWLLPTAIILCFCLHASMYEPSFFATGIKGEQRIDNICFYMFILQSVLCAYLAIQLIKWKWKKRYENIEVSCQSKKWIRCIALVSALVIALTGVLVIYEFKVHQLTLSSASAMVSLLKGKAHEYRRVCFERLSILKSDEANVVLPLHVDPPYVLMWADIQADPTYWVNTTLAEYYGKESVAGQ